MTILPGTRSVNRVNVLSEIKHSYLISDAHIFNFSSFCVTSGVIVYFSVCLRIFITYQISHMKRVEENVMTILIEASVLEIK